MFQNSLLPLLIAWAIILLFCVQPGHSQSEIDVKPQNAIIETQLGNPNMTSKQLESKASGLHQINNKAFSLWNWINSQTIRIVMSKIGFSLMAIILLIIFERASQIIINFKLRQIRGTDQETTLKYVVLDALRKPLALLIWAYGLYIVLSPLLFQLVGGDGESWWMKGIRSIVDIGGTFAVIWFIYRLIPAIDARVKRWAAWNESKLDDMLAPFVGSTLRLIVITIGALMLLQNVTGIQIGPILASLGLGGLAVALAAKDPLANFFGTLTILLEKPFQIGDHVIIEGKEGVVESIGYRSTKIRAENKQLISIPNQKIITSIVENFNR